MGLVDVFRRVLPLSDNDQYCLEQLEGEEEFEEVRRVIKEGKAKFLLQKFNISIFQDSDYFQLVSEFPELNDLLIRVNSKLKLKSQLEIFNKFKGKALETIRKIISSNVPGMVPAKNALALQLASKNEFHILIFGDNHMMKTMANNAAYLSPRSAVSHASSVMSNNSLYHARGGLCVIHDLMMMHRLDKNDLDTAMNTGFIIKDGVRFDTRAKIAATIKPSGGIETSLDKIRQQLPREKTLDRFNLLFLAKKSSDETYKVAIKKQDQEFIHDYISYSQTINVNISRELEAHIKEFVASFKKHEFSFIMDIPSDLPDTMVSMAKASARLRLSSEVQPEDVNFVKESIVEAFKGN